MRIAVVYVFPQVQPRIYFPMAARFSSTWKQNPPGSEPCTLYVVGNGGQVPPMSQNPFVGIPNRVEFLSHNNVGWDIGAFQMAAEKIPCDLMVCLGSPVHFHLGGWLDRIVDAYLNNGPGLYGCWCYMYPNPHIRTTAFWFPPELLQSYPSLVVSTTRSRYNFEHGGNSITRHVLNAGMECYMVTQEGCFPFSQWENHVPGVEGSLMLDQHIHR